MCASHHIPSIFWVNLTAQECEEAMATMAIVVIFDDLLSWVMPSLRSEANCKHVLMIFSARSKSRLGMASLNMTQAQ